MTRKNRNLLISALALAALILVVLVTRLTGGEEETAEPSTGETPPLVNMAPGEIRRLATENPDGGITLSSMDGENWLVEDLPQGFQLKDTQPQSMVNKLTSLGGRLIEENAGDLTAYGLASPSGKLRLVDRDGTEAIVFFGNENPSGTGRYAVRPGSNAVYLVPSFRASDAFWSLSDLREDRLPEIAMDQLASLLIQSGKNRFRAVPSGGEIDSFQPSLTGMEVVEPWSTRRPVDDYSLRERLTAAPPPSRIAAFLDEQPGSLTEVGLTDNADRLRLETTDGAVYDLEIGERTDDGYRYAREMSHPDLVFLLREGDLELLNTRPFDITTKHVFLAGIDRVDGVEIQKDGNDYALTIDKLGDTEDDSDDRYFFNGREIPEKAFKKAYTAVIGLLYEGVAKNPPMDRSAEIVIRFSHVDPAVEDVSITFMPYDAVYYTTSVAGGESEFLISRYQLESMLKTIAKQVSEN